MSSFEDRLVDMKDILESDPDVVFAYLFGSIAEGRKRVRGDVDIAVYLVESEMSFCLRKEKELYSKMTSMLGRSDIDLIILNRTPTVLKYRALKTGKLLVSKDDKLRINYVTKVMLRYFELKRHIEEYDKELYKRIRSEASK